MLELFIKYIADNKLFDKSDKILIGVSGGIDSMVLCDLFLKSGLKFAIAHCNFRLRGNESDGDEALVENFAKRKAIDYHVIHFDTNEYAREKAISIQMAARDLRYNWFNELLQQYNYQKIAVAHHADDNIETFFTNLSRGAGINGLCGMPLLNGNIIRPLLFASRSDIVRYSEENGISYRNDSSNVQSKYARNRIRLNIIPEFEKINPSFKATMLDNLEYLQAVRGFVNSEMDEIAANICRQKDDKLYLDIEKLKNLACLNLFLYHTLNNYGFKNEMIERIATSLNGEPGKQFNSHTHTIIKDRDYLIIAPVTKQINEEYYIEEGIAEIFSPLHLTFEIIEKQNQFETKKDSNIAQFDYAKLQFPLILRRWRDGDSFVPFGMTGRKKLSNYFSDNKYSLFDKQEQWLLVSGGEIVWIAGKRIDNRFKINDNTQRVLQVTIDY